MKKIFLLVVCLCLLFPISYQAAHFSDVSTANTHRIDIHKLADLGIIKGYKDDTFKPEGKVTNRDVAVMLARALKLDLKNVKNPGFTDVPTSNSAYKEIAAVTAKGIFPKLKKFNPNDHITRAGMARALQVAYNIKVGTEEYYINDVTPSHWAYPYVMRLVTTGIAAGYNDGTFRPSEKLTRGQFSSFLVRAQKYANNTRYFKHNASLDHDTYMLLYEAEKFYANMLQDHNALGTLGDIEWALVMLQENHIIRGDGPDLEYNTDDGIRLFQSYSKKYFENQAFIAYGIDIRNFDFSVETAKNRNLFYRDGYYHILDFRFRSTSDTNIEPIELYQLDHNIYYVIYEGESHYDGKWGFDGLRYAIVDVSSKQPAVPYFSEKPITTDQEVDALLNRYENLKVYKK